MTSILLSGQMTLAVLAALGVAYGAAYAIGWIIAGLLRTPWRYRALTFHATGAGAAIVATPLAFAAALEAFALLAPADAANALLSVFDSPVSQTCTLAACDWRNSPLLPLALGGATILAGAVIGLTLLAIAARAPLLIAAALLAAALALAWWVAGGVLAPLNALRSASELPPWLPPVAAFAALAALAAAALWAATSPWRRMHAWRRDARFLVGDGQREFEVDAKDIGKPATSADGAPGRRIVIFCDGTSNRSDQITDGKRAPTNVWRLYDALEKNELQTGWYDAGVGSETSSQFGKAKLAGTLLKAIGVRPLARIAAYFGKIQTALEAATGAGITENIVQAYCEIVRQYRPGDRIYLIGFSRGAYTARCVAGVIRRCGVLRSDNLRCAADVVRLYRTRKFPYNDVPIRADLRHAALPRIAFMGLFDTVAALGVPLWGWWFNARCWFRNVTLDTNPSTICRHISHALAMDERRSQFFPTLFTPPETGREGWLESLDQQWFRGAHADIGGGYAETGLSDITLGWMLAQARTRGLTFDTRLDAALAPDPLARLHNQLERQPSWRYFGSWPRWHPVEGGPDASARFGTLHASVLTRRDALRAIGRHDQTVVGRTEIPVFVQPQREWDRTGLVLEGDGKLYALTWKGEPPAWRDSDCVPCGPAGQADTGVSLRWLFRGLIRMPDAPWMTLCLTIAHPRDWPLREGGLNKLYRYLAQEDPIELRRQVAAIGTKMVAGRPVIIRNDAGAGLLYLFANDAWATAANNSGSLALCIQRVDAGEPDLILTPLTKEEAEDKPPAKDSVPRWYSGSRWQPGVS